MCRSKPQLTLANHLTCLTSLAPEPDPSRLCSSFIKSFRIADLHKLHDVRVRLVSFQGGIPGDRGRVWKADFVFQNIGKGRIPVGTLKWRRRELKSRSVRGKHCVTEGFRRAKDEVK